MEKYGRSRLLWTQELAGSNPAYPTNNLNLIVMSVPYFRQFFNPEKSITSEQMKNEISLNQIRKKRLGLKPRLIWDSRKNGTYIRDVHGSIGSKS